MYTFLRRLTAFTARLWLALVLVCVALGDLSPPPVRAATVRHVYMLGDDPVNPRLGTLRYAIEEAESGDTVRFDPVMAGETVVLQAELIIVKTLTIDGASLDPPVTISGDNATFVFDIRPPHTVTLRGLTIADGYYDGLGGAIQNTGTLFVLDCAFVNNSAGGGSAIMSSGSMGITSSTFEGNSATQGGGAIYSSGVTSVTDSVLRDNVAQHASSDTRGGAIWNMNRLTVTGATFEGNEATYGGAIANRGDLTVKTSTFRANVGAQTGGAIHSQPVNRSASVDVTSSTFTENRARQGAAIMVQGAEGDLTSALTLSHSTLSGNQVSSGIGALAGPLVSLGSTWLSNNIVADDYAGRPDCYLGSTADNLELGVSNLIEDGSCASPTNLAGDPLLGPLADRGGHPDATYPPQTMALLSGSPAINAADDAYCLPISVFGQALRRMDQRGFDRPETGCDIGAFELQPPAQAITSNPDDVAATAATLRGYVRSADEVAMRFEYGLTEALGQTVAADPARVTAPSGTYVSRRIEGLAPNTAYHYRVVAANDAGEADGGLKTFTTEALPPGTTPDPTVQPTPDLTAQPTPGSTAQPTPGSTAQPTPSSTAQPTPGSTAQPTPGSTAQPTPQPTPGNGHRIHLPLVQR